jgi:hypothetical protein
MSGVCKFIEWHSFVFLYRVRFDCHLNVPHLSCTTYPCVIKNVNYFVKKNWTDLS